MAGLGQTTTRFKPSRREPESNFIVRAATNRDYGRVDKRFVPWSSCPAGSGLIRCWSCRWKPTVITCLPSMSPRMSLRTRFCQTRCCPRLRSKRALCQAILVAHGANLFVNRGANLVVNHRATTNRRNEDRVGVIEEPGIRDTIAGTVESGEKAFQPGLRKYGF